LEAPKKATEARNHKDKSNLELHHLVFPRNH
jgi:hypothetical protein